MIMHELAVQQIIQKYESVFIKEFGAVTFEMQVLEHENEKNDKNSLL